jgi:hypothetical protein
MAVRYTIHNLDSQCTIPGRYGLGYRRLAILRVDESIRPGHVPKQIRRHRGVDVLYTWDPAKPGKTSRCRYQKNLIEQRAISARLTALYSEAGQVVGDLYRDMGIDPESEARFAAHVDAVAGDADTCLVVLGMIRSELAEVVHV